MPVHDGDFVALPLASRLARVLGWLDPTEDRSDTLQALHATDTVDDLGLVSSADVDPAVSSGRHVELDGQLGVAEGSFRPEIPIGSEGIKGLFRGFID